MKKIIALILLISSLVQAQVVIRQDDNDDYHRHIMHTMTSTTDGYTAVTGLTPTCTIRRPGATSFVSCTGAVTEIGTGVYRGLFDAVDWENPGTGMMILTGAAAIPSRIPFQVLPATWPSKNNLIMMPNDIGNSYIWTLSGATRTANTSADYIGYILGDTLTADGATSQHKVSVTGIRNIQGSGLFYGSVEVKSGTANNAWVGDENWNVGLDINTSTGVVSATTTGFHLRGWKLDALVSGWYRAHWLYEVPNNNTLGVRATLAIGNGNANTAPPSFASSGTMLFARAVVSRADDVSPLILEQLAPNLQSAASSSTITLALSDSAFDSTYVNREICMWHQGAASRLPSWDRGCGCIATYTGSTRVATLHNSLWTTPSSNYKYKIGGFCSRITSPVAGSITNSSFGANAIDANAFSQAAADKAKSPASINMGR